MAKQKEIIYRDELNDEFSEAQITPIKIDENYVYLNNSIIHKLSCFFWYRVVAFPLAMLYVKLKFKHKVVGRKKLKKCKDGAFLFGNHTHHMADAFIPTLIGRWKRVYVIVHPNNVSIKYMKKITPKIGAIPLPDDLVASKNFQKCIQQRFKEKEFITIYPEAHIWPYYTKIRPFPNTSFRYPVNLNSKSYCFTNTYQKRLFSKHPKIITYIDGPFFPDETMSKKEAQQKLRDEIYDTMTNRSKLNNVEYIKYIKETNND